MRAIPASKWEEHMLSTFDFARSEGIQVHENTASGLRRRDAFSSTCLRNGWRPALASFHARVSTESLRPLLESLKTPRVCCNVRCRQRLSSWSWLPSRLHRLPVKGAVSHTSCRAHLLILGEIMCMLAAAPGSGSLVARGRCRVCCPASAQ